jgi:hypothetical protein
MPALYVGGGVGALATGCWLREEEGEGWGDFLDFGLLLGGGCGKFFSRLLMFLVW